MRLIRNAIKQSTLVVGVIAGTPVDTLFGVNFLAKKRLKALGLAVSKTPQEQTELQALNRAALTHQVFQLIEKLHAAGANAIMIYCNSLSGAIDLEKIRAQSDLPLICPLDVYKNLAGKYKNFGLLSANCQSSANIERLIIENDPRAKVIGTGNQQLVEDIEKGYSPAKIIRTHGLVEMATSLHMSGIDILILACTHFRYFYAELKKRIGVEILEPSELMVSYLLQQNPSLSRCADHTKYMQ